MLLVIRHKLPADMLVAAEYIAGSDVSQYTKVKIVGVITVEIANLLSALAFAPLKKVTLSTCSFEPGAFEIILHILGDSVKTLVLDHCDTTNITDELCKIINHPTLNKIYIRGTDLSDDVVNVISTFYQVVV